MNLNKTRRWVVRAVLLLASGARAGSRSAIQDEGSVGQN